MSQDRIDLRSDTVTLPAPAMLAAMTEAPLGDDVYGEDPTVARLEALAAARVGMEAAVFVPSGTMGNLCAVLAHCGRGEEAIVGDRSHIFEWEAGGASVLGGVPLHPMPNAVDGTLALARVDAAIRGPEDSHEAPTRLLCLESTHNECGGPALPLDYLAAARQLTRERGLALHLDGARLFNAAAALGVPATAITTHVDSVMFCLSKGLAAPVGSMLAGPATVIARARRVRKMLGGGMRQAGVLAAAGIVALDRMVDRLAEDHEHARRLAQALAQLPAVRIDLDRIQSNIVCFTLADRDAPLPTQARAAVIAELAAAGVLISDTKQELRAVTHYGVEPADIDRAAEIMTAVLARRV
ncbi:low-specificity L-threonine aldolase [Haliangium sp.]|uniref:low-specificity L-threonine aldolase n=1 Tax=Haliangium sp. TaxID=2663208 RepID=UPI003D144D2D